jgi:hypothetical protein
MPRGVYQRTPQHSVAIKRGLRKSKRGKLSAPSQAISYPLSSIKEPAPKNGHAVTYSRSEKRVEGTVVETDEKAGEIKIAMGTARLLIRTR